MKNGKSDYKRDVEGAGFEWWEKADDLKWLRKVICIIWEDLPFEWLKFTQLKIWLVHLKMFLVQIKHETIAFWLEPIKIFMTNQSLDDLRSLSDICLYKLVLLKD